MSRRYGLVALLCLAAAVTFAIQASAAQRHHARGTPTLKVRPKISGKANVGSTLRASHGRWLHATKYTYRWQRCNSHGKKCKAIRRPGPSAATSVRRPAATRSRAPTSGTGFEWS